MVEFQALDQVNAMNEVVKTVVYYHQTLDQQREDLEDAIEDIDNFYKNRTQVEQQSYDLEGKEIKIKILRPLSRDNQDEFNSAMKIISGQVSGVYVVANNIKKELYKLSTERIAANQQNEQVKPIETGVGEKIKNFVMSRPVKTERQYSSLNELDDPFKISLNQVQQIENFTVIFDRFIELHTSYGVEVAEETIIAGQQGVLDFIVNIFNSRIKSRLFRLIEEAQRVQRETERNEAVKALLEAKNQADRMRNAQLRMMPVPTQ